MHTWTRPPQSADSQPLLTSSTCTHYVRHADGYRVFLRYAHPSLIAAFAQSIHTLHVHTLHLSLTTSTPSPRPEPGAMRTEACVPTDARVSLHGRPYDV